MRISVAHRCRLARTVIAACLPASLALALAAMPSQAPDGFTTNGLHYRSEGRGPTVVLIHAFHMDLREWDDIVPLVAATNRIVRYDVRGHGRSKITVPLPSSVDDLLSLLDELKVRRASLVGLSMGSNVALDFALTHPGRVERLVLLSPGLAGIKASGSLDWMQPIGAAVRSGDSRRAAELWWEGPLLSGVRQAGPSAARYRSVVIDNASVWTLGAPPPQLDPPAGKRLNEIKAPVVAAAGALDRSGSLEFVRMIAEGVPQGRAIVIEGAGHMLAIEKPREVSRLVTAGR
jgi:2-succinyl-6-hydroxy-2,4-cyclohexadiene-1-carboxylate synthase